MLSIGDVKDKPSKAATCII